MCWVFVAVLIRVGYYVVVFLYWASLVERQTAHDACLAGVCKKGSEAICQC